MHAPAPAVVELSETICAPAAAIWQAIVDPELGPRWLGGFHFESTWTVGAPLAIVGVLNSKAYREEGQILAIEPGRLLRYEHWSRLWRVPNTAEHRAVLSIRLEAAPDGEQPSTRVIFHHDLPAVEALPQHSNFFWRGGLYQLRLLCEGTDPQAQTDIS